MSGLEVALATCAFIVGLTGTWSPCGLSMVETLGPRGHASGRTTTVAACMTFAVGSLVGGVLTFGSLAVLGDLVHGAGGRTAYLVAAGIAAVAALAELRGVPIVPQVRRQLPEHWRRLMPMPVAGAAYGVLLGLGFTTFVLTFGVWALIGISAAVGSPELGLIVGLGFGVGRALPIVVIAPAMDHPAGIRATELMTEQPAIYRGFRLGDALALGLTALVLVGADRSEASPAATGGEQASSAQSVPGALRPSPRPATSADPSIAGADLAFDSGRAGFLRRGGRYLRLPGRDPALAGNFAAVRVGNSIRLFTRVDFQPVRSFSAPGADALSISSRWLVYRTRVGGDDRLVARRLSGAGGASTIAIARGRGQLSRPSVWGSRVAYAVAGRRSSRVTVRRLGTRRREIVVRTGRNSLVTNPALRGGSLLYVRTTRTRQQLRLKRIGRRGLGERIASRAATSRRDRGYTRGRTPHRRKRVDLRRSRFTLWSTALGRRRAYITRMSFDRGRAVPKIARVRR